VLVDLSAGADDGRHGVGTRYQYGVGQINRAAARAGGIQPAQQGAGTLD
jgi:hypothetical protein